MRCLAALLYLLTAVAAAADDGFVPLDPTAKGIAQITQRYFDSCPPRDDEDAHQWNERCVPAEVQAARKHVRVIDGDTIEFDGEIIRIANIDAPEIRTAKCHAERLLADQAKLQLETMTSGLMIKRQGTDRYGRTLALLRFMTDVDVGDMMVKIGVAVPWSGRRHNWCE